MPLPAYEGMARWGEFRMSPRDITAVLVTRGGYDISEVVDSLKDFAQVLVWDNSEWSDNKVWGRYIAASRAEFPFIFTMDDDCLVDAAAVCSAYEPGIIVANSDPHHREVNAPFYRDGIAPIGWGAVFDSSLTRVFDGYFRGGGSRDELFHRECDRVFTALNTVKLIEVPFRHLDRAHAPDRMWREKRHLDDLAAIRERIQQVKKKAA